MTQNKKKKQIFNIVSLWFTCFQHCLRKENGGAKAKELQICFRFKVNDRTTKQELIIERLFPIRISANPGRDCKEFDLNSSNKIQSSFLSSSQGGLQNMVSPNAILSAIDDEEFKNNLSEEERAAFCQGLILISCVALCLKIVWSLFSTILSHKTNSDEK